MSSDSPDRSRRRFLSQASFALTSVGVGRLPHALTTGQQPAPAPAGAKSVIQRTLGRTGIKVPIVSMGVMNARNPEVLKRAYDVGVRFFDTAQAYDQGRNEEMVGSVISQLGVRDKVYVQTKIGVPRMSFGPVRDRLLENFAGCLKRLRMDYVDVLLIHQITEDQMGNPDIIDALKEAKRQKTARFIGVSTHQNAAVLNSAAASGFCDVVLFQFNFLDSEDKALLDAMKNAASKGIGLVAMKTQTGGRSRNMGPLNQRAMLKWVLRHPEIATAIPGYTNMDQVNDCFSVAYGLDFTNEEKSWLGDRNVRLAVEFCSQCGTCLPTCPKGVDVPALMRVHMYAASYTNFDQARQTLEGIPAGAGLRNCSECRDCSARCAHNIRIRENIADLKDIYV